MRITSSQFAARPAPYDRNAITRTLYSNGGGIVPHGETTRATYTVPAGKKAFFESAFLRTLRASVAAPAAVAYCAIYYTPNGGSAQLVALASLFTNGVNDERIVQVFQIGTLYAGDAISIADLDASTGGTVGFLMQIKGTEFDV